MSYYMQYSSVLSHQIVLQDSIFFIKLMFFTLNLENYSNIISIHFVNLFPKINMYIYSFLFNTCLALCI